jgi:hypothetical protein
LLTLAPAAGGKKFDTALGKVDIGHVMAGIDATLNPFPSTYPSAHLKARGHDSSDSRLKYDTLKTASGGDNRDFTTWAGDLGQAYAEFLVDRHVKGNTSAKLADFMRDKAPPQELLGDVHGYVARDVWKKVPASKSPTGGEFKVSNILRDLYLVRAKPSRTHRDYLEGTSGHAGSALDTFVAERSEAFARPWFAKKAVEHRGWWSSKGLTKSGILENAMNEFDTLHASNKASGAPADQLDTVVADFLRTMSKPLD